jgi:hypothetical protein
VVLHETMMPENTKSNIKKASLQECKQSMCKMEKCNKRRIVIWAINISEFNKQYVYLNVHGNSDIYK